MELWYVVENGTQRGPLPRDVVLQLLDPGVLTDRALAWRNGMADWQPIVVHFDLKQKQNTHVSGEHPTTDQLTTDASTALGRVGDMHRTAAPKAALTVPLAGIVLLITTFFWTGDAIYQIDPPFVGTSAWIGV